MELYQDNGLFIAKTQYGEWGAKQAGFQWDKLQKVWKTTDPQKAQALAAATGLAFGAKVAAPAPETPGDLWPTVIEGRYAVVDPMDGVLKFYRVDKPEEGAWRGWTFLKVMASDTFWKIKDKAHKKLILDVIALNPKGAMALYGQKIGSCGYCGKTLTDALSRQIGIGPICRGKLQWDE